MRGHFTRTLLLVSTFAVLFALCAPSHAILTFGKMETGFMVPVSIYNPTEDTSVGINVKESGLGKTIYWSFFLADGSLGSNGAIPTTLTRRDYSFSLAGGDAGVNNDHVGYLVFTLDDDGILQPDEDAEEIGGHAFLINPGNGDAALLPVVPLDRADYAPIALDLNFLNPASIVSLTYGQSEASAFECRYLVDPAFGATTRIVIWSLYDAPPQFTGTIRSVSHAEQYDVVFTKREKRLNVLSIFDNMAGRPEDFLEGSVVLDNPGQIGVCFVIVFSDFFHALQTLPAFEVE
ncbi:MAG: hypothetical protein IMF18_09735 [Proteobacteria bacterium]|nr:hypothetical protein [Pseudomonadota bacterium]